MYSVADEKEQKTNKAQRHSLLRESMKSIYDGAKQSASDLHDMILFSSSKEDSRPIEPSASNSNNDMIENKQSFVFEGELLTLKVLFIDIFILLCALICDFVQATNILIGKEEEEGDITFALFSYIIIWIPGIPAAIHYLSVFRHRFVWYKSLIYAVFIILFYPIVPIIAKLVLIWMRPRNNKITKEYLYAEYGATVAYAIYGCVSAPIQLCYQCWLILNGVMPWDLGYLTFIPFSYGRNDYEMTWPSTPLCLVFSILTILKTTWVITTIHLEPLQSWKQLWNYVASGLNHLPFSLSTTFFRMSSIVILQTYIQEYAFVSTVAFWIATLIILVKCVDQSVEESSYNSIWLISFMALFVPAYYLPQYTEKVLDQRNILIRQRKIYRYQNMAALLCYFPSLLACLVITNIPCNENLCYNYQKEDKHLILNNYEFNCIICMIIVEGIISNILAWNPSFSAAMNYCSAYFCNKKNMAVDHEENSVNPRSHVYSIIDQDKDKKVTSHKYWIRDWKYAMILLLSLTPFVCGTLLITVGQEKEIDAYLYFNNNKSHYLTGTLISSKRFIRNNTIIDGQLRCYKHDPKNEAIVATTIKESWSKAEKDIEKRVNNASALIIYEEFGKERPSSPLPFKFVKLYSEQDKIVVVRVKHDLGKIPLCFGGTVAIVFEIGIDLDEKFPYPDRNCDPWGE